MLYYNSHAVRCCNQTFRPYLCWPSSVNGFCNRLTRFASVQPPIPWHSWMNAVAPWSTNTCYLYLYEDLNILYKMLFAVRHLEVYVTCNYFYKKETTFWEKLKMSKTFFVAIKTHNIIIICYVIFLHAVYPITSFIHLH